MNELSKNETETEEKVAEGEKKERGEECVAGTITKGKGCQACGRALWTAESMHLASTEKMSKERQPHKRAPTPQVQQGDTPTRTATTKARRQNQRTRAAATPNARDGKSRFRPTY